MHSRTASAARLTRLTAGPPGYCEQSQADPVILGADCDTTVADTTNGNLWACTGVNAGSCFTAGTNANCCGCPSWAPGYPGGACQAGNNANWQSVAQPIALEFNTSSPTSYAFPYDDAIKLFNCQTSTAGQAVNYTVNFCPNNPDGDAVQNSNDADVDNDGVMKRRSRDGDRNARRLWSRMTRATS